MDMETILEETVDTEDLKKFEQKYHVELNNGKVCLCVDFYYAHVAQGPTKVFTVFKCHHIDGCFTGIVRVSV